MMTGFGMGFGGLGLIGMILFWVAVIAGVVWLVKTVSGSNAQFPMQMQSGSSAREILDQRYARGELSREQHEAMKQDLQ